ncbi:hypothetical protein [Nocardia sp. NPDC060249]|uniref:hypothetical protein n=1 Tax=Nocardia sp. NPDC060249 TaxID=3347082 RepID=UPI0036618423
MEPLLVVSALLGWFLTGILVLRYLNTHEAKPARPDYRYAPAPSREHERIEVR